MTHPSDQIKLTSDSERLNAVVILAFVLHIDGQLNFTFRLSPFVSLIADRALTTVKLYQSFFFKKGVIIV